MSSPPFHMSFKLKIQCTLHARLLAAHFLNLAINKAHVYLRQSMDACRQNTDKDNTWHSRESISGSSMTFSSPHSALRWRCMLSPYPGRATFYEPKLYNSEVETTKLRIRHGRTSKKAEDCSLKMLGWTSIVTSKKLYSIVKLAKN